MIDAKTIEELRGLLAKATPGPWKNHLVDDTTIVASNGFEIGTTWPGGSVYNGFVDPAEQHEINAALIVAMRNALPSLLAQIEKAERERDEAQMEIKRHFPVSNYNGLDIEQWKDRALAAERILALSGQHWRERWYGSGPQKGSWIYADRDPVAFIGPDATAHALTTAIVMAHNAALRSLAGRVEASEQTVRIILKESDVYPEGQG